jgi:hypothetical protein
MGFGENGEFTKSRAGEGGPPTEGRSIEIWPVAEGYSPETGPVTETRADEHGAALPEGFRSSLPNFAPPVAKRKIRFVAELEP